MAIPNFPRPKAHATFRLMLFSLALATCCLRASAQEEAPTDAQRNPAQMILFHQHPEEYKGGKQLAVTVYISAFQWNGLTAMGLYETVPEGWKFRGTRAVAGAMPSVVPAEGASGTLQFLWIEQSNAPITFQYLLDIPPRDSGPRYISGQVEYRQGEGALTSNVAFSQLTGLADELPVITLQGASGLTVALNATFNDPGATATDPEDGNLSNRIEVAGAVNTNEPGTYTLTYGVTDSVGNQAVPVSRQVTVSEAPAEPGGGTPEGEKPDTATPPAMGGLDSGPLDRIAAPSPERDPARPPIKIPDITLGKNTEEYTLPLKSGHSNEEQHGDTPGEPGSAPESALRRTQDADRAAALESSASAAPGMAGGAATDDAAADTSLAQSPVLLIAVALILAVALAGLWYQSKKAGRRARRPDRDTAK